MTSYRSNKSFSYSSWISVITNQFMDINMGIMDDVASPWINIGTIFYNIFVLG